MGTDDRPGSSSQNPWLFEMEENAEARKKAQTNDTRTQYWRRRRPGDFGPCRSQKPTLSMLLPGKEVKRRTRARGRRAKDLTRYLAGRRHRLQAIIVVPVNRRGLAREW
jgi:hypothetical protein